MARFRSLVLGVTAGLVLSGAALAGDYDTPTYSSAGFDWDGFYAGIGVSGSSLSNGVLTDTTGYIDVIAGANYTNGNFLIGLEGWFGGYSYAGASGYGGGVEARAGYLASDDVLVYAGVGGYFYDAGGRYTTLGAGVEFALSDQLTIDTEYKYWGWSTTGYTGHSVGASVLWHF